MFDPQNIGNLCGWLDVPARHVVAARHPSLTAIAPRLVAAAPAVDIMLYKAWKDVLGAYPGYVAQQIGDCFPSGTAVAMAGGDELPIEEVRVGDLVLSHRKQPQRVLSVLRKFYTGDLVTLRARGFGREITCTPDHRFISYEDPVRADDHTQVWTSAERIGEGALVLVPLGPGGIPGGDALPVGEPGRRPSGGCDVFCLSVKDDHSFIANGYAVHNCTSFGAGHAVDLLAAVQIVVARKPESWKEACTEALYGEGREIANMLGGGDGCYGGALAEAVSKVGVIPREAVGPYSGKRAQQWGRTGTPADIKAKSHDHLVGAVALVSTWDELRAALGNGYPVTVASNQGFQMVRDDKGICEARGSWAHQMMICGIFYSGTSDECAVIANSWGDDAFSGPAPNDMPVFAFGGRRRTVERMLAAGDSWAFSNFDGFPGQVIPSDWTYDDFI